MFQCRTCSKLFSAKRNCVRHELSHKVSFKRNFCVMHFRRRDYLLKHVQRQHNSIKVSCTRLPETPQIHQTGGQCTDDTWQALSRAAVTQTLRTVQNDQYDILAFLSNAKLALISHLKSRSREEEIKWYIAVHVEFYRENRDGTIKTVRPYFRSLTYPLLTGKTLNEHGHS